MSQNKVSAAERIVLKMLCFASAYISVGHNLHMKYSVELTVGHKRSFSKKTFESLKIKGLIDGREITKLGIEAAIKGYYGNV